MFTAKLSGSNEEKKLLRADEEIRKSLVKEA